jgi:hypothetical protein
MDGAGPIDREKIKRALEREIDELVQAKIKEDADRQIEELKASRVRGGLPRVADPNVVPVYLQRFVGLFKSRERERVFDIVRESVCHELLRKASWAAGNDPANEEFKIRLELLFDITAAVEERVLHMQKKSFLGNIEFFEKKSEKAHQQAMTAKSVLKRIETKIEVYETAVAAAAEYFGLASAATSDALTKIGESKAKSAKRIAVWQERQKISQEKDDEAGVELCREYVGRYQHYLEHYAELAVQVERTLSEHQSKMARMERAREFFGKKLIEQAP